MEKVQLSAAKRTMLGKKSRAVRKNGKVPAVLYGRGVASQALEIDGRTLERLYREAGLNRIIALKVDDARARNVLIQDVQLGPIKGELLHVDFYAVRMNEELKTEVPLRFVGESVAVYQNEGTLVKSLESIEVECLPSDLPKDIEVDISILDDFEKAITLADIDLPDGVRMLAEDRAIVVAKVEPPRTDLEMAELEEPVVEDVPEDVPEEALATDTERGDDKVAQAQKNS